MEVNKKMVIFICLWISWLGWELTFVVDVGFLTRSTKKAKIDKRRGISTKIKIERSLHSKVHQNDNFLTACHKIKFDELYMIHFNSCNPDPSDIFPFWHCHLYHALENAANKNRGKPLYSILDIITPIANFPLCPTWIGMATVFPVAWYKIVIHSTPLSHILEHSTQLITWMCFLGVHTHLKA